MVLYHFDMLMFKIFFKKIILKNNYYESIDAGSRQKK